MLNKTLSAGKTMNIDLEAAMSIEITRKNIPDYTLPLLSAWLGAELHGIRYEGNAGRYLYQVGEKLLLPMPKDEIDHAWVQKLYEQQTPELLLAFLAKVTGCDLFEAYVQFNLIKHRHVFSPDSQPIEAVVIGTSKQMVTAAICSNSGYRVSLVTQRGFSRSGIDQIAYGQEINWIFGLVFSDVVLLESTYDIDTAHDDTHEILAALPLERSTSALVTANSLQDVSKQFGLLIHIPSSNDLDPTTPLWEKYYLDDGLPSSPKLLATEDRINSLMTGDKKTFVKAAVSCSMYSSIMALDFEHPGKEVLMLNLIEGNRPEIESLTFGRLLGDEDYTEIVNTQHIIGNKYNFVPRYYKKDYRSKKWLESIGKYKTEPLAAVVTFYRPLRLTPVEDISQAFSAYEILLSDINEFSRIGKMEKQVFVNKRDALRLHNEGVEPGDIIFAIKGDIGRTALIENADKVTLNKAFIGLRIQQKYIQQGVNPEYLVAFLSSDDVRRFIQNLNTGEKVDNLRMDDLKSIPIVVDPSFIAHAASLISDMEVHRQTILEETHAYNRSKNQLFEKAE